MVAIAPQVGNVSRTSAYAAPHPHPSTRATHNTRTMDGPTRFPPVIRANGPFAAHPSPSPTSQHHAHSTIPSSCLGVLTPTDFPGARLVALPLPATIWIDNGLTDPDYDVLRLMRTFELPEGHASCVCHPAVLLSTACLDSRFYPKPIPTLALSLALPRHNRRLAGRNAAAGS